MAATLDRERTRHAGSRLLAIGLGPAANDVLSTYAGACKWLLSTVGDLAQCGAMPLDQRFEGIIVGREALGADPVGALSALRRSRALPGCRVHVVNLINAPLLASTK